MRKRKMTTTEDDNAFRQACDRYNAARSDLLKLIEESGLDETDKRLVIYSALNELIEGQIQKNPNILIGCSHDNHWGFVERLKFKSRQ